MDKQRNEFLKEKLELVLNRLMNLENRVFDKDVNPWNGYASRDFGIETWDWPQGVALYSLEMYQNLCRDTRYDAFFEDWVKNNMKRGLPSANINTTIPYFMLLALAQRTENVDYDNMCIERAEWLMDKLPKTKERGFQHVTTDLFDKDKVILNEEQLWVDTLFMSILFLAEAGIIYDKQKWINEAIYQILIHIKYLYDKQTGLFYHGWSFDRNDNFGGVFWARGNSWFTYGVLVLLDTLKDYMDDYLKEYIYSALKAQVNKLQKLQAKSGLWHTILTDTDSYEEVSGTAGFAAGIIRGMQMGILDSSYSDCAMKALDALIENIGEDGTVQNVSGGTAMGLDADHYKNIIIAPMPYGQAMAAMALVESLKM